MIIGFDPLEKLGTGIGIYKEKGKGLKFSVVGLIWKVSVLRIESKKRVDMKGSSREPLNLKGLIYGRI